MLGLYHRNCLLASRTFAVEYPDRRHPDESSFLRLSNRSEEIENAYRFWRPSDFLNWANFQIEQNLIFFEFVLFNYEAILSSIILFCKKSKNFKRYRQCEYVNTEYCKFKNIAPMVLNNSALKQKRKILLSKRNRAPKRHWRNTLYIPLGKLSMRKQVAKSISIIHYKLHDSAQ